MITRIPFCLDGFNFLEVEANDTDHDGHHANSLIASLPANGFAIVGTRDPQRKSFELLEKTMEELRGSDLVIVSGFARGIDSRAHELALEHGLKTIAILGCGLDIDYPRENRSLRNRILDHGGLILSPFEPGTSPIPRNFLNRNQLIAYFAKAVWVVEAAAISGTLNTARHASDLHRDLYATPSFPNDVFFEGNQKLLSEKDPNRYPTAHPFFDASSLGITWQHLRSVQGKKKKTTRTNITKIQRWILDLQHQQGECRIQSLMNFATSQGLSPGQFYFEYEKELSSGKISEDLLGIVDLK